MVHPVSNYSLPYELTFTLKPEKVLRLILTSPMFFSPVWISPIGGAGLLKVVELHVFIQLLQ